jgi:hypothetical protein
MSQKIQKNSEKIKKIQKNKKINIYKKIQKI